MHHEVKFINMPESEIYIMLPVQLTSLSWKKGFRGPKVLKKVGVFYIQFFEMYAW